MKRVLSLLVALVLLVSMFALPTFALAEGTSNDGDEGGSRAVGFNAEKFKELVADTNKGVYVNMGKNFTLNQEWLTDNEAIHDLFEGIEYHALPKEKTEFEDDEATYDVTYYKNADDVDADEVADTDVVVDDEGYHAGQHVTLKEAKTFKAETGDEFIGWLVKVQYDGEDSAEYLLYRAGDKFVMPAHNIDVVAYWYPVETKEEDKTPDENNPDDTTTEDGQTDSDEPTTPAEPKKEFAYTDDIICLEYITPSDDPKDKDDWKRVAVDKEIELSTAGWWMFRYVVIDGANGDIEDDDAVITPYNTEKFQNEILEKSEKGKYNWEAFCLYRYAVDTAHPEIALSDSMKTKMEDGLTVGTKYTILTSLSITDSSSTSVTYVVERYTGSKGFDLTEGANNSDGEWVPIYDSTAKDNKVLEAGKDYISSSGVITPVSADVTGTKDLYRYRVIYSVKDANGFLGVDKDSDSTEEFHPILYLGVKLSPDDAKEQEKMETWKIILFVIAGLAAIGIVVLLCIKPKQTVAGDSRVSDVEANAEENNDAVEPKAEPEKNPDDAE